MSTLKMLKKTYDKLSNDHVRSFVLNTAEHFRIRKDVIRMDTNNFCNIRCIMCNQRDEDEKPYIMSLENFKTTLDHASQTARMLYLSCGHEPLVTPNFEEYIKYAKSTKIPFISICTNALLLTDRLIESLVDNGIDEIIISFNGFCEEDYNRIMKGSDFEKVCNNIQALTKYKQQRKTDKPHIRLNSILIKSNLLYLDDILPFMLKNDICTIQFRELLSYEGQNNPQEVENELISGLTKQSYEQTVSKIKDVTKKIKAAGKEIILPSEFWKKTSPLHDDAQISKVEVSSEISPFSIQKKSGNQKQSCCIPYFSYWIDCEGTMQTCRFDNKSIIGNVLSDEQKLLKSRRTIFRKSALDGKCSHELCKSNIDSSLVV